MANSETILSAQTYNQLGGSAQSVVGEKYRGDGYYGRSDGFHTVQYTINGFIGVLNIQATLAIDPLETDWFTIYTQTCTTVTTGTFVTNFTGNYVWVRATVTDWSDGAVNSIKLNH